MSSLSECCKYLLPLYDLPFTLLKVTSDEEFCILFKKTFHTVRSHRYFPNCHVNIYHSAFHRQIHNPLGLYSEGGVREGS